MDDQSLGNMLQSYVSEAETAEIERQQQYPPKQGARLHIRIWLKQNGKALSLLTASAAAIVFSLIGQDMSVVSNLLLGIIIACVLIGLGVVGLMID